MPCSNALLVLCFVSLAADLALAAAFFRLAVAFCWLNVGVGVFTESFLAAFLTICDAFDSSFLACLAVSPYFFSAFTATSLVALTELATSLVAVEEIRELTVGGVCMSSRSPKSSDM